ncbi:hypothetical protein FY137_18300 [Agrobacterium tumefaciens]|nr:hypothetical protein FY137_18300 [Agrobacterium tumefaciens]
MHELIIVLSPIAFAIAAFFGASYAAQKKRPLRKVSAISATNSQAGDKDAWIADYVTTSENIESEASRKTGQTRTVSKTPGYYVEWDDSKIRFFDDDGNEHVGIPGVEFSEITKAILDQPSDDLVQSVKIAVGSVAPFETTSSTWKLVKSGKVVSYRSLAGSIIVQGGIKAKGRRKGVLVSLPDDNRKTTG